MPFSHLPAALATPFRRFALWMGACVGARLAPLLVGILLARGQRTATAWFRAGGIGRDFRPAYYALGAVGRQTGPLAGVVLSQVEPILAGSRLTVALDDTPTKRYGPKIEGAGFHHNPTPGPAGTAFLWGHVWVCLAALARHPQRGTVALPLRADLYVRAKDVPALPPGSKRPFLTKLELAAGQLRWLAEWTHARCKERWVVVDGAYAKRPFLRAAKETGFVVVGRLRRDAALCDLPGPRRPGPGRPRIYGEKRIRLALRAGQRRGWQEVTCVQYGQEVRKKVKTFLATWRPAGGVIRVVLVEEDGGQWLPFFCTDPEATAGEILEAAADRNAQEQSFKAVKEVWGAEQQQVRNLAANVGCFNLNGWMATLVEAWAWEKEDAELVDRRRSPWDDSQRRPSHADKRKALQREVWREELQAALGANPNQQEIRELAELLLEMAA